MAEKNLGLWRRILGFVFTGFEILIGLVLLFSSLMHFSNVYQFYESLLRYEIVGAPLARYLVVIFLFVSLNAGVAILTGILRRGALVLACIMFSVFAVAQCIVLCRGQMIDCGCFGSYSHKVGWTSVVLVGLLALATLACVFRQDSKSDGGNFELAIAESQ